MVYLQEQHWEKLFTNVTMNGNPWYGIWSVYSPDKQVVKSSQGIRNIPTTLKVGEAFKISAGKLMTENEFKRLIAKYDDSGSFIRLISEVFYRQD
jgi:Domain of unknown function (DUF3598)